MYIVTILFLVIWNELSGCVMRMDLAVRSTARRGDQVPYATNGTVKLYHEAFGKPTDPAIVLVAGWGVQCVAYAVEWCQMFADKGFRVIRFDNRDAGLSSKLEHATGDPPYMISDMAADTVAVLDSAGVPRAHVVGFSMGGMIVQRLAIEHPDRVASITSVMQSTGDPDVGYPSEEALATLFWPAPRSREEYIAQAIDGARIYGSPGHFDAAWTAELAGQAYDRCFCPRGKARQLAAASNEKSRTPSLSALSVPALVLHGDRDPMVPISGGQRTAAVIPGARFEVLRGMGHDWPPAYWPAIVELVTGHATSGRSLAEGN